MLYAKLGLLLSLGATVLASHGHSHSHLKPRDVSTDAVCPDADGNTYTDADGYTYKISCGIDFNRGAQYDLSYIQTNDLASCLKGCSDYNLNNPTTLCSAAVHRGIDCWFKSGNVTTFVDSTRDSGLLISSPTQDPSCPGDDGKTYIDADGSTYKIVCGTDYNPGYDLTGYQSAPDLKSCAKMCSDYNLQNPSVTCDAVVTRTPSDCWLKSGTLNGYPGDRASAVLISAGHNNSTCPASPSSGYKTPEGDGYSVSIRDTPVDGTVLSSAYSASACDCAEQCSSYNRQVTGGGTLCRGAEYNPQAANGATCLVKS